MKYCSKCGKELFDEAVICPNCGCAVDGSVKISTKNDAPNMGFAVLGFFFPIIGFILWLVMKDDTPLKAKSAGKGALIGLVVGVVSSIILSVLYGILISVLIGGLL